jgi:hypothetical protein
VHLADARILPQIDNNLKTYITILTLSGTASQNGVVYATFDYTFANPTTTNAGENPGPYTEQVLAKLPQGAAGSLPLLVNSAQGVDIVRHFRCS